MVDIENEIWKETHLSPNYLVSNMGRVKSIDRNVPSKDGKTRRMKGRILKQHDYHGYYHVGFIVNGKHVNPLVHQLVIFAFNEMRRYPEWEIDHINGNSHDNRLENLEYVTSSENSIRAIKNGLQTKESMSLSNKSRKMTPEEIIEMKEQFIKEGRKWGVRYDNRDFLTRYAKRYNMKIGSVQNIITGATNRFFGKDIVQTTKDIFYKLDYNKDIFDKCKTMKDKFRIIAEHFKLSVTSISCYYYHNKMSIEELIDYYNSRYTCNESCSSKG